MKKKKEKAKKGAAVRALNWIDVETTDGHRYKIPNVKTISILDYRDRLNFGPDPYANEVAIFQCDTDGKWYVRHIRPDMQQIVDGILCRHKYLISVFERPKPPCSMCKDDALYKTEKNDS